MLSSPVKSSGPIDYVKLLLPYIKTTYGEPVAARITPKLRELNELRTQVASMSSFSEALTSSVGRYLALLDSLELRFTSEAVQSQAVFSWTDSLTGTAVSLRGWRYERANVLFNYAALESVQACSVNRSTPEGIKEAGKLFLGSATMFQHIRDHIANGIPGALPFDLTGPGLTMLSNMMLAQAQKVMFEHALNRGLPESTLAKVIWFAGDAYGAALRAIPAARPANFTKIVDWEKYFKIQISVAQANAMYHEAKAVLEKAKVETTGYGTEIAYLKAAYGLAASALTDGRAAKIPTGPAEGLLGAVKARLDVAIPENDTVYMDFVPPSAPAITGQQLAQFGVPPDFSAYAGADLLAELIDPALFPLIEEFKREFEVTLATATGRLNQSTDEAKALLSALHLPGAVEASESASGIPDSTWSKIYAVQSKGGLAALMSLQQENVRKAADINTSLDKVQQDILSEEASDSKNREVYTSRWTLLPSTDANKDLKDDINRYRELLRTARQTDDTVSAKLGTYQSSIAELTAGSRDTMSAKIPTASTSVGVAEPEKARLKGSLFELAELIQRRDELIAKLTEAGKVPILGTRLSALGAAGKAEAFAEARASLSPSLSAIEDSIAQQGPLLERIKVDNAAFLAARESDPSVVARQTAIQALTVAADKFDEIESNLKAGGEFYGGLHDRVQMAASNASGLIAARQMAQQDLLLSLKREASAPPPAGPPAGVVAPPTGYPSYGPAPAPYPAPPGVSTGRGGYSGYAAPPAYGTAPPAYGTAPGYPGGYPPAGYAQPPRGYAPPQGYAQPPQGYAAPPAAYGPPPGYAPAPGGYYAPAPYHAPAPAPAAASWSCPVCTFINHNMAAPVCEVCGTPRK